MSRRSGRIRSGPGALTKRQEEVLLEAFRALHVRTAGSPDPEAVTGRKMQRLEVLGLACAYEVVDGLLQYRLTPEGVVAGRRLHLASQYGSAPCKHCGRDLVQEVADDRGQVTGDHDCPAVSSPKVGRSGA